MEEVKEGGGRHVSFNMYFVQSMFNVRHTHTGAFFFYLLFSNR